MMSEMFKGKKKSEKVGLRAAEKAQKKRAYRLKGHKPVELDVSDQVGGS